MRANTNKAIAINTVILYVRLLITVICQLLVTSFALKALGETDFGLFSVVGSIIIFVGIINTIMVATSNRFIAVAIGKNDIEEENRVFNACLVIHLVVALVTTIIALPVGEWYINHFVHYDGAIENAILVYRIVIFGSIISFISVPYHGLLTAVEKFFVFCGIDILCNVLKLTAAALMLFTINDKLTFYASTQGFLTAVPTLIYWLYCKRHYPAIVAWKPVKDKVLYRNLVSFSGWVGFGAIATVGKAQAAQLLVNAFFNTIMNAALGVANTINHFIVLFANNITQPMAPQITKNYASGNFERCNQLLSMSTKFTFLTMLTISSPFFSDVEWILNIWLGKVPPYAALFAKLLVLDALVASFNAGISNLIFASGKLAFYQFSINSLRLLSVAGAYVIMKAGYPPYSIFLVYIVFSVFITVFTQISLQRIGGFSFRALFKNSYFPSTIVCLLYAPILFIRVNLHPLLHMILILSCLLIIIFFVGLNKSERRFLIDKTTAMISKFK